MHVGEREEETGGEAGWEGRGAREEEWVGEEAPR